MARQIEGINGGFAGKVGTVIGYQWRGRWCMRSYPRKINDRRSAAQIEQRNWFIEAVRFASRLVEVLRVGLRQPSTALHMTEGNLFVRLNTPLFGMAEGRLQVDYEHLVLSDGGAAPVGFGPMSARDREVEVDFSFNPARMVCDGSDKVYLVAIGADNQEAELGIPTYRRKGHVGIDLPSWWGPQEVHLYGMVQTHEGVTSPTQYIGRDRKSVV